MNSDSANLKYGKARQEKYLEEAQARREWAAYQANNQEACEIEPRRSSDSLLQRILSIFHLGANAAKAE